MREDRGVVEPEMIEVDARGLYCPLPIIRVAAALRSRPAGTRARLRATDPGCVADVAAFCAPGRAKLLFESVEGETFVFEIEKDAEAAADERPAEP